MSEQNRVRQSRQVDLHIGDSDLYKGAKDGTPEGQGNANAEGALDEQGLPSDEVAEGAGSSRALTGIGAGVRDHSYEDQSRQLAIPTVQGRKGRDPCRALGPANDETQG